jgi:hypothetical protein
MVQKGASPSQASPAAKVTACCSAMPTSYTRSGKNFSKWLMPVPPPMAACTTCDANSCEIVTVGISRGGSLTRAVTRRPPVSLHTMVPRTAGYAYDVGVWGSSIVQGPFSVAPCQTLSVTIRNFFIVVRSSARGRGRPHLDLSVRLRLRHE